MYILSVYIYDYHEWEEPLAVGKSFDALYRKAEAFNDRESELYTGEHRRWYVKRPILSGEDLDEIGNMIKTETSHYRIYKIEEVTNDLEGANV